MHIQANTALPKFQGKGEVDLGTVADKQVKNSARMIGRLAQIVTENRDRFEKEMPYKARLVFHNSQRSVLFSEWIPNVPTSTLQASLFYDHLPQEDGTVRLSYTHRIDLPEREMGFLGFERQSLESFVAASLEAAKAKMDDARYLRGLDPKFRHDKIALKLEHLLQREWGWKKPAIPVEGGRLEKEPYYMEDIMRYKGERAFAGAVLQVPADKVGAAAKVLINKGDCKDAPELVKPALPQSRVLLFDDVPVVIVPQGTSELRHSRPGYYDTPIAYYLHLPESKPAVAGRLEVIVG